MVMVRNGLEFMALVLVAIQLFDNMVGKRVVEKFLENGFYNGFGLIFGLWLW